jgi:pimeloyl-ACP methyl ester carboxylesterase
VVVVGHSLDGLIAAQFARQYPARVAVVVLLDATAPSDGGAIQSMILGTVPRTAYVLFSGMELG